jgi:hypothetical protein
MIETHEAQANASQANQVMELVNLRALQLMELPGDEREERFEVLKDQDFWSAMEEGMSCADAWDISERVDLWTRCLIGRIVATGGAQGGRA